MCGIVAYTGRRQAAPLLMEGLQRLEYRGYDSAGIAVIGPRGLRVVKTAGRVRDLEERLPKRFSGTTGIAHTRWATHGAPTDLNAHPHMDASGRYAVVHNGIVENAAELRAKLATEGIELASETDTEIIAQLIALAGADDPLEAVRIALSAVSGTYGLAVLDAAHPSQVVLAANGSPVVLGIGEREMFAASDAGAIVSYTRQIVRLDDGELAVMEPDGFRTFTLEARATTKRPFFLDHAEALAYDKGGHPFFMHKEIHDQPEALARTLSGRLDKRFGTAHLGGLNIEARGLRAFNRVKLIGCGSAYYAGEIGAQLIESLARVPADAEPASEFRYRNPVIDPNTLYVALSQSGSTADTLAAVQEVKRKGAITLGVVNVVGSPIAVACDGGIYLHAGPEVSVAATKSFTCTIAALALLAVHLGRLRDLSLSEGRRILEGLEALPELVRGVLAREEEIATTASRLFGAKSLFYIGRVRGWPVAREGAQKLKEISYLHAEAYPASELKHGPLALVDPELPTVAVVPDDELKEKNISTLAEIKARNGPIVAIAHSSIDPGLADEVVVVPKGEPELDSVPLTVALQLLAYHVAVARGLDVDRPRNLAKSVTVE
jgi:glucosamine--fructose-6-phosphate aminotransferase (isomerizing)